MREASNEKYCNRAQKNRINLDSVFSLDITDPFFSHAVNTYIIT